MSHSRAPLTEIAHRALQVVSKRCDREGLDLFQELNRVGLIASEPRIREIQELALKNMHDRLEAVTAGELLWQISNRTKNPGTPEDLYQGILDWIRQYIAQS